MVFAGNGLQSNRCHSGASFSSSVGACPLFSLFFFLILFFSPPSLHMPRTRYSLPLSAFPYFCLSPSSLARRSQYMARFDFAARVYCVGLFSGQPHVIVATSARGWWWWWWLWFRNLHSTDRNSERAMGAQVLSGPVRGSPLRKTKTSSCLSRGGRVNSAAAECGPRSEHKRSLRAGLATLAQHALSGGAGAVSEAARRRRCGRLPSGTAVIDRRWRGARGRSGPCGAGCARHGRPARGTGHAASAPHRATPLGELRVKRPLAGVTRAGRERARSGQPSHTQCSIGHTMQGRGRRRGARGDLRRRCTPGRAHVPLRLAPRRASPLLSPALRCSALVGGRHRHQARPPSLRTHPRRTCPWHAAPCAYVPRACGGRPSSGILLDPVVMSAAMAAACPGRRGKGTQDAHGRVA